MPRQAIKPQLCKQVRKLFCLQPINKIHFTQPEMMKMAAEIKNTTTENLTWEGCGHFFEEELYELGWEPQETVDTHPTITNLNWLISKKQAMEKTELEETQKIHHTNVFTKWSTFLSQLKLEPKEITINETEIVIKF